MSMTDALKFIAECRQDTAFRGMLYGFSKPQEFRQFIHDSGYDFTDSEMANVISNMKLRAADEFEAEEIAELGQLYTILARPEPLSACAACRGGCH